MSEHVIRALDASTWDAFARLAEKHNGMGFGGCWCTAIAEKWGYWSDGVGELVPFCPECARREFAPDAPASGLARLVAKPSQG